MRFPTCGRIPISIENLRHMLCSVQFCTPVPKIFSARQTSWRSSVVQFFPKRRYPLSYQDRDLSCVECNQSFVFTADDQQYHAEKGYTNEPKRCPSCRQARRSNSGSGGGMGGGFRSGPREMHPAVCAQCGKDTEVPFLPRGDRPVYCSDCFSQQPSRSSGGGSYR